MIKFILIGLGNPGKEYSDTYHNAGFQALDLMIEKFESSWIESKLYNKALLLQNEQYQLYAIKPMTYMNLSGNILKQFGDYKKIVLFDDIDISIGKIRYGKSPYKGSHNGIKSIQNNCNDFQLIRIGIKPPLNDNIAIKSFVLSKINNENALKLNIVYNEIALQAKNDISIMLNSCISFCSNICSITNNKINALDKANQCT